MLEKRELKLASRLLLLLAPLFLITLTLAYHLPIYTDEIGVQMSHDRYFTDHSREFSLYASCNSINRPSWPATVVPVMAIESSLVGNLSRPILLRWLGIAKFLLWIALAAALIRRGFGWRGREGRMTATLLILSAATIAVLPFLMVIDRPEQALLLGITAVALLTLFPPRWLAKRGWIYLLLIPGFADYLLFEHPKSLFFLPLLAGSLWLVRLKTWQRGLALSMIAGLAWQAIRFYSSIMACPGDAYLRKLLTQVSLAVSPKLIWRAPGAFLHQAAANLFSLGYLNSVAFSNFYMSYWLPSSQAYPGTPIQLLNLGMISLFLLMIIFSAAAVIRGIILVWRGRSSHRQKRCLIILTGLLCGLCAAMATESIKDFYQSALIIPLWVLAFYLSLGTWNRSIDRTAMRHDIRTKPRRIRLISITLTGAVALSIVSQLVLIRTYLPLARTTWSQGGEVPRQDYSISGIAFEGKKRSMTEFFSSCGLAPRPGLKHVLIDDLTYPLFWDSVEPFHALYLTSYWGKGIKDLRELLLSRGSDGIALRCRYLDTPRDRPLLALAQRQGNLCCIPRSRLEASVPSARETR